MGAFLASWPEFQVKTWQKVIAGIVLVAPMYAGLGALRTYTRLAVDAPDLWSVASHTQILLVFTLLQALALLMFITRPAAGSKFFVYLMLRVLAIIGVAAFSSFFAGFKPPACFTPKP